MIDKHYFIINMQHPCLSKAELETLIGYLDVKTQTREYTGVITASLSDDKKAIELQERSATIKEAGRIISIAEADEQEIYKAIIDLSYCPKKKPYVKPTRIQRLGKHLSQKQLITTILKAFKNNCKQKLPSQDKIIIRAIYTDGIIIIGEALSQKKKGDILSQNPHNLPFYKPGALNPWFTRLLVNLSLKKEKKHILYDPFCGTSTIPLTAINEWGIESICSDIRRDMCAGARKNLEELAKKQAYHIIRADARNPPLRSGTITNIVTDPPYGRSVRSIASTEETLAQETINRIPDIMENASTLVFSLPIEISEKLVFPKEIKIERECLMYVHNQLTRKIMVLEKNE